MGDLCMAGNDADILALCDTVRQTSLEIHTYLRHGHLEKVYENALAHRLHKRGIDVGQQYPLAVFDEDGAVLGEYFVDLLINGELVVELKAARAIADEHIAQVLGYLRSSRKRHAMLINFGTPKNGIKKLILD